MLRGIRSFLCAEQSGAIGPAYAVGILALVAIAGVGFDYGRLAGLDTELQNAADQAALAGATQLDGEAGACVRALSMPRRISSPTTRRIETDAGGPAITFVAAAATTTDCAGCYHAANGSFIKFYADKDKTPATGDDDANFIEVKVDARTVRYALTPLVGAISSGLQIAGAMAGLGTSICKVPPVFICNPDPRPMPIRCGRQEVAGVSSDGRQATA